MTRDKNRRKKALKLPQQRWEGVLKLPARAQTFSERSQRGKLAIGLWWPALGLGENELTLVMQTMHKEKMRIAKRIKIEATYRAELLFSCISLARSAWARARES